MELRGGTHLVIHSGETGVASLGQHDRFTATDPEGNTLVVNSDHSIDVV